MAEEYEDFDEEGIDYAVRPNKTQIKRDIAELSVLAEDMARLSSAQLGELALPEELARAIGSAAIMPQKGARKRQMKFITGLLRKLDAEPIKEKLAGMKSQSALAVREHHNIERWRDRLLAEGDTALTELFADYPRADRQLLRQIVRSGQKEMATGKPPKSARELYQSLKTLFEKE
ncbi:MAG: DUF615 domain-containing protein [Gammaproteobacteria bacterium HGW-Gammaproteobacteria-3]|nr:MAG: DUF615 domain-containing protein [Gammaproteobacteria bacterium HGW-Gammaproteobacteria-3]